MVKDNIFPLGKKYKLGLAAAIARDARKNTNIIVGVSAGGLPQVLIYDSGLSKVSRKFFVDTKKIKGEFNLTVGDINGDGAPEIIAVLNSGRNKQIKIFTLAGKLLSQFKVSTEFNLGPASVGAADVNFDGIDEIVLMNGE